MAIKILFGPGGSGKSFFQMHIIIKQLRETRRNILTNLAINVGEFNAYLEKHYPNESLNLVSRLRILTPEETFEFWKYRGNLRWTGDEYNCEEDKGVFGVCYVIDEAGVSGFSATGWAVKQSVGTRGERCLWYLDQQRKFGDDVFASTNGRTPEQIAKPFRDKAHGFIKLKNSYLAVYGPFRGRGRFEWSEFLEEPRKASESIAKGIFTLGELAECYRTQDGVGVIGNAADKGARAKGVSILWVIPAAFVLAACCFLLPWALGKAANHAISGGNKSASSTGLVDGVASASTSSVFGPARRKSVEDQDEPEAIARLVEDHTPERPLWVTGYVVKDAKINVQLSDGRFLTEKDKELQTVERNSVTLNTGQRLYMLNKRAISADSRQAERFSAPGTPTPVLPDQARDVRKVAPVSGS